MLNVEYRVLKTTVLCQIVFTVFVRYCRDVCDVCVCGIAHMHADMNKAKATFWRWCEQYGLSWRGARNRGELPDGTRIGRIIVRRMATRAKCREQLSTTIVFHSMFEWKLNDFDASHEWFRIGYWAIDSIYRRRRSIIFDFLLKFPHLLCWCLDNASERIGMRRHRNDSSARAHKSPLLHSSLSVCPKHVNLVRCHFSYFIFILSNAVSNFFSVRLILFFFFSFRFVPKFHRFRL